MGKGFLPYTEAGLNVISNFAFDAQTQEIAILLPSGYWNKERTLTGQLCVDDQQRFGCHVDLGALKGYISLMQKQIYWTK